MQLKRFLTDQEGGTLIEYAFLASLIGMAAIAAMSLVGSGVTNKLTEAASALS